MPHKLVALLFIFGTIALMVAWIPCMDATSRLCQYLYGLFCRTAPASHPRAVGTGVKKA